MYVVMLNRRQRKEKGCLLWFVTFDLQLIMEIMQLFIYKFHYVGVSNYIHTLRKWR